MMRNRRNVPRPRNTEVARVVVVGVLRLTKERASQNPDTEKSRVPSRSSICSRSPTQTWAWPFRAKVPLRTTCISIGQDVMVTERGNVRIGDRSSPASQGNRGNRPRRASGGAGSAELPPFLTTRHEAHEGADAVHKTEPLLHCRVTNPTLTERTIAASASKFFSPRRHEAHEDNAFRFVGSLFFVCFVPPW